MGTTQVLKLSLISLFMSLTIATPTTTRPITTTSKYQIACTMCSACDNPCDPVSSPPPPRPSPPPPSPPPPTPSSSSSNCPPPPTPSSGSTYYSPPPPSQPSYNYASPPPPNGIIGGTYYPPPNYKNYPTPPPPNPIVPYFPFYYYSPPPPSIANSIGFSLVYTITISFSMLLCLLL